MRALALSLNYNTPDLFALQRQEMPDVQLVDNGSAPPMPGAFIRNETNGYFSGGWNEALRQLGEARLGIEYVWCLNSDVTGISLEMLTRLVSVARERNLDVLSPGVGRSLWPQMRMPGYQEPEFVDWVAPLVDLDWFLGQGGFDPALPGHGSDLDLLYRARGSRIAVDGRFQIRHPYGGTASRVPGHPMYDTQAACRYLLAKHGEGIRQWAPMYFRNYRP